MLAHHSLVTSYGVIELGQHWFRQWLVALRLPEPILTDHQWNRFVFKWVQFYRKCSIWGDSHISHGPMIKLKLTQLIECWHLCNQMTIWLLFWYLNIWTSLSAVRERPLNLITHSLVLKYLKCNEWLVSIGVPISWQFKYTVCVERGLYIETNPRIFAIRMYWSQKCQSCIPDPSWVILVLVGVLASTKALTHWGRDKMATILETFSNAFSWMKMYKFQRKIHWSLFSRVQLTTFQHWFR